MLRSSCSLIQFPCSRTHAATSSLPRKVSVLRLRRSCERSKCIFVFLWRDLKASESTWRLGQDLQKVQLLEAELKTAKGLSGESDTVTNLLNSFLMQPYGS